MREKSMINRSQSNQVLCFLRTYSFICLKNGIKFDKSLCQLSICIKFNKNQTASNDRISTPNTATEYWLMYERNDAVK